MRAKLTKLTWFMRSLAIVVGIACVVSAAVPETAGAAPRKGREKSALAREPGAIYLEDFTPIRVDLTVKGEPPIYKSTLRKDALGLLKRNGEVELVAMTEEQYRVRGEAKHGTVIGWVLPEQLTSLDPDFIANLRELYERQKLVEELIDGGEIALGMTIDEVGESLGRPSRKSSRLDKGGRMDIYEYVTYKRIPQSRYVTGQDGQIYQETYYIKVESGKLTVSFKDKVAESIEETEGEPSGGGEVRIVSPPIILR